MPCTSCWRRSDDAGAGTDSVTTIEQIGEDRIGEAVQATWIEHDRAGIALGDGRVRQSNFHDYIVARMPDMLPIDTTT